MKTATLLTALLFLAIPTTLAQTQVHVCNTEDHYVVMKKAETESTFELLSDKQKLYACFASAEFARMGYAESSNEIASLLFIDEELLRRSLAFIEAKDLTLSFSVYPPEVK